MMIFKKTKPEYYNSIETLPAYNWFKIHERGDLSHLIKNIDKLPQQSVDNVKLASIWSEVYNQYLNEFGIDSEFRDWFELKKEIELLKLDSFIEDDPSLQTFVEIKELEMETRFYSKKEKSDFTLAKAYIEKFMGMKFSIKEITVREYYTYIKLMQTETKTNTKKVSNDI